ncbi:uncharacterized protein N7459_002781 [Penicillium hispanicum]|uniref:uncharacterized protein n=1 Tax=Penicillium hispanicum TaxID=1080232 RepID=UPI00254184B1|nr:uncharacterized protein N7459_002781 [Penicillium hispanicum]KAJ5587016.1 hypothetical protein N7459_002781 [Penicillium hispanicum]
MIRHVQQDRGDQEMEPFSWTKFFGPALEAKIWFFALIFFANTALGSMGFSVGASQCLIAPPYALAALISDRYHIRGLVIIVNTLVAFCGLALMGYGSSDVAQYIGCFLVTAGGNGIIPSVLTYQANNIQGQWSRAFFSATIVGLGSIGGIVGGIMFRTQDAPRYPPGIWTSVAFMFLVMALVVALSVYLYLRNQKPDAGEVLSECYQGFRYDS